MSYNALFNFYLDISDEDESVTDIYLTKACIDPEESHQTIFAKLKEKEAELKINSGKELQKRFETIKSKVAAEPFLLYRIQRLNPDLAFKFRNLTELTDTDKETLVKIAGLIENLEQE